ncbi:MAG: hypothetical protein F6K53_26245 [Moorea sp. SIO4A1]|nr:hypothetical protein [Moorena sp. SIO4A1]
MDLADGIDLWSRYAIAFNKNYPLDPLHSRLPTPDSRFPIPDSLFPTPCSLFPTYHQIPQRINTTAHIL